MNNPLQEYIKVKTE